MLQIGSKLSKTKRIKFLRKSTKFQLRWIFLIKMILLSKKPRRKLLHQRSPPSSIQSKRSRMTAKTVTGGQI